MCIYLNSPIHLQDEFILQFYGGKSDCSLTVDFRHFCNLAMTENSESYAVIPIYEGHQVDET